MSIDQSKKEKLTTFLYESFLSSEFLTINDIMKLLNVSRRTAYNYIERLKKNGVAIYTETKHGKSYYFVKRENINYLKYKETICPVEQTEVYMKKTDFYITKITYMVFMLFAHGYIALAALLL